MLKEQLLSHQSKNLPYRRGVGMMVINNEKKVFVGKRIENKNPAAWQMPQGGIDENETILEAALRELKEETNIESVKVLSETKNWLYYDIPESLYPKFWGGKYRGQKQKWLLMHFYGDTKEINVQLENQEFDSWSWSDLDTLADVVVDFKKSLYINLLKEFRPIIDKISFE